VGGGGDVGGWGGGVRVSDVCKWVWVWVWWVRVADVRGGWRPIHCVGCGHIIPHTSAHHRDQHTCASAESASEVESRRIGRLHLPRTTCPMRLVLPGALPVLSALPWKVRTRGCRIQVVNKMERVGCLRDGHSLSSRVAVGGGTGGASHAHTHTPRDAHSNRLDNIVNSENFRWWWGQELPPPPPPPFAGTGGLAGGWRGVTPSSSPRLS
jgi:hypothetical protein